jgi:hypothetical protein
MALFVLPGLGIALTPGPAAPAQAASVPSAGPGFDAGGTDTQSLAAALKRDLGMTVFDFDQRAQIAAYAATIPGQVPGVDISDIWLVGRTVFVHVDSKAEARLARATGAVPTSGTWRQPDSSGGYPVNVNPLYSRDDAAGGSILVEGSDGYFGCTGAFWARTRSKDLVLLTAGHCLEGDRVAFLAPGTKPWGSIGNASEPRLGSTATYAYGGGEDYGVVAVSSKYLTDAQHQPGRLHEYGASGVTVTGVAQPVVGMPVCKSGGTTGLTCGTVTAVGTSRELSSGKRVSGFEYSACSSSGDSGAAVFSGTLAVGVLSYGSWRIEADKDSPAVCNYQTQAQRELQGITISAKMKTLLINQFVTDGAMRYFTGGMALAGPGGILQDTGGQIAVETAFPTVKTKLSQKKPTSAATVKVTLKLPAGTKASGYKVKVKVGKKTTTVKLNAKGVGKIKVKKAKGRTYKVAVVSKLEKYMPAKTVLGKFKGAKKSSKKT